jgi:hypothetical protein
VTRDRRTAGTAPSRRSSTLRLVWLERRWEWLAYSFLATTPIDEVLNGNPRRVVPLLGFQWGFDIRPESVASVELQPIAPVTSIEWAAVSPVLRAEYPSPLWTFAASF